MSLYIVYQPEYSLRTSSPIFLINDKQIYLFNKNVEKMFLRPSLDIEDNVYHDVLKIAEEFRYDSFEIVLNKDNSFENTLKLLSDYLIDKDINIGLITNSENLIKNNTGLFYYYGVTFSPSALKKEKTNQFVPIKEIPGGLSISGPLLYKKKICDKPKGQPHSPNYERIKLEESFHDKFMKLIIESNKDNAEIYKASGITRQVFSKIVSDKNMIPTKLTIVSLCIGLQLPLSVSEDLLNSAGYSLSKSLIFDSIIHKYLKNKEYDFYLINEELNEHNCPLLGWHPREE